MQFTLGATVLLTGIMIGYALCERSNIKEQIGYALCECSNIKEQQPVKDVPKMTNPDQN